jgi:hypothetical protein
LNRRWYLHSFSFCISCFYSSYNHFDLQLDCDYFRYHGLLQIGVMKFIWYPCFMSHILHTVIALFKLRLEDSSYLFIEHLYTNFHSRNYLNVTTCEIIKLLLLHLLYVLSFAFTHYCFAFTRSICKICCGFASSNSEIGCHT